MYRVNHFMEDDRDQILAFMQAYPFAMIMGTDAGGRVVATPLPLLVHVHDDAIILRGHLMKRTDHHEAFLLNPDVLVVYNGPQAYISASWYTEPAIASTWNYMAVHARGRIQFMNDKGTIDAIRELTDQYEPLSSMAGFNQLSGAYVSQHVKAIVGFDIQINHPEAVFKLSQNCDQKSYDNIITELHKRNIGQDKALAEEMSRRRKK
ncbi:MAG TPA: hypothetical protein DHV17_10420 [Chitinophagaceae bacterium]|nr:hypothetical protein [Chitinophagaceae bacterium]